MTIGRALRFDGVKDYVTAAHAASGFALNESFWVAVWVNPVLDSLDHFIVGNGTGVSDNDGWHMRVTTTNRVRFILFDITGTKYAGRDTSVLGAGWHRIVAVWSGSGTPDIYVDGALDNQTASNAAGLTTITNTTATTIGRSLKVGTELSYDGFIDDVRIYRGVPTLAMVQFDYNAGAGISFNPFSGLVAWWRFDENGVLTNAVDSSGNGYHGTLTNFVFGGFAHYPGTNGQVRRSSMSYTSPDEISFEWKSRPNATGSRAICLYAGHLIEAGTDQIQYWINIANQSDAYIRTNSYNWEHIVLTMSFLTNEAKLYVNGTLVRTTVITVAKNAGTFTYLSVGAYNNDRYFLGDIDFFRIYHRILTPTEAAERAAGIYSSETSLQLHYNFNEGTGTTATDSSANAYTGTMSGDATFRSDGWVTGVTSEAVVGVPGATIVPIQELSPEEVVILGRNGVTGLDYGREL